MSRFMLVLGTLLLASIAASAAESSPCVILKRMGPADEITSHFYSFGIRGKQFQFIEGQLPKGVKFHGRLTDHDVRQIQDKGGKIEILESKYATDDLRQAREACRGDAEQDTQKTAQKPPAKKEQKAEAAKPSKGATDK